MTVTRPPAVDEDRETPVFLLAMNMLNEWYNRIDHPSQMPNGVRCNALTWRDIRDSVPPGAEGIERWTKGVGDYATLSYRTHTFMRHYIESMFGRIYHDDDHSMRTGVIDLVHVPETPRENVW